MPNTPLGVFDIMAKHFLGDQLLSGNFTKMIPGLTDLFSSFYFKAPAMTECESHSKFSDCFLYNFEYIG